MIAKTKASYSILFFFNFYFIFYFAWDNHEKGSYSTPENLKIKAVYIYFYSKDNLSSI